MKKQHETITCVSCPYCKYKILATCLTEKKLSEIETYEFQQRSLNDHIKLHEEAEKYRQLCGYILPMTEIIRDDK